MAVLRKAGEDIPKDVVVLDSKEAIKFQWKYVFEHRPKYEMWPFRHGLPMLSVFAGASSMYINSHFRRQLRLKQYGRIASYLPLTVTPTVVGFVLHKIFVTDEILLQSVPCSLCLYSRAVGIQLVLGFLYPLGLAPLGNLMLSLRFSTARVPEINDFKGHVDFLKKISKPLVAKLPYLVCAHIITAIFITNREIKAFDYFYDKLLKEEEAAIDALKS